MKSWRSVVACWIGAVFLLGALMFGAVACGSDDDGDQPADSTPSEVEDDADDLEEDLDDVEQDLEDEADELEKEADELEDQLEDEADELEEDIRGS